MVEGNVDSLSFPTQSQSTNDFPEVGQVGGENPLQLEKESMASGNKRCPASLTVAFVGMFEDQWLGLGLGSNVKIHLTTPMSFFRVETPIHSQSSGYPVIRDASLATFPAMKTRWKSKEAAGKRRWCFAGSH